MIIGKILPSKKFFLSPSHNTGSISGAYRWQEKPRQNTTVTVPPEKPRYTPPATVLSQRITTGEEGPWWQSGNTLTSHL